MGYDGGDDCEWVGRRHGQTASDLLLRRNKFFKRLTSLNNSISTALD